MMDHSSGGYEPLEGGLSTSPRQRRRLIIAGSVLAVLLVVALSSLSSHKAGKGLGGKGLEKEALPTVLLPYPQKATLSNIVICNFSGKDYWYRPEKKGGAAFHIPPVTTGDECAVLALADVCAKATCWKRGSLSECNPAHAACVARSEKEVSSAEGTPSSKLVAGSKALVQGGPSSSSSSSSSLPVITFPYPAGVKPSDVVVCNYSGERMWYSWDDSTQKMWENGPDHNLINPLQSGHECVTVERGGLSWHRGFIAPCPKGQGNCFRDGVRTVTAGVNVVGIKEGGQAECVIDCSQSMDVCSTASVVFVSPARCQRVSVKAV